MAQRVSERVRDGQPVLSEDEQRAERKAVRAQLASMAAVDFFAEDLNLLALLCAIFPDEAEREAATVKQMLSAVCSMGGA